MSRVSTPHTPTSATHLSSVKVPHEKISMRAYEKWCKRGRPHGSSQQDWYEAEAELRSEMSRMGTTPTARR
jgi:hypothetical protein